MSQGNKMLLTFHTDFSNEENGTIMFYKGFLAYYQAVGEWSLGALLSGVRHIECEPEIGNLESNSECLAFLVFFPQGSFFQKMPANLGLVPTGQHPQSIREAHRSRWPEADLVFRPPMGDLSETSATAEVPGQALNLPSGISSRPR